MPIYSSSKQRVVQGTNPGETVTQSQFSTISSNVPLERFINPIKDLHPAVDATNGPILTDSGLTATAPSFTNMTKYQWDSGVFNTQSQNWSTVLTGTGQNTTGQSMCFNNTTPRTWTYGNMSPMNMESCLDTGWVTDATTITIAFFNYTAYTGTGYCDMTLWVEHQGRLKRVDTGVPITQTASNGFIYRTLTFKEARNREFRILLPHSCWFAYVYINQSASIAKSANRFLIATNGDSWNEPHQTGTMMTNSGGGFGTGTYYTYFLSQAIIEQTGWAVILMAEGGTGEYNCNDGVLRAQNYVNAGGESVFHGQARINDFITKFGARNPLVWTIGGWNDGTLPPAPVRSSYAATVLAGIDYFISKKPNIQLMYSNIQPVSIAAGDARDLARQGQADAIALRPLTVIGMVDSTGMWIVNDTTATGQRMANVNNSDNIHLHAKGADMVAAWYLAKAKKFQIPLSYVTGMMAA